jgi:hypothetical protein
MSRRALAGRYGPAQKDGKKRSQQTEAPLDPLDFVLTVMRDKTQTPALRAGMAKAALPYLHKRGEEQEEDDAPEREPMSDLELARRIAHILDLGRRQAEREGKTPPGSESDDIAPNTVPSGPPPAPPTNAGQSRRMPTAPASPAEEHEQRGDPFDPTPGYRWI